MIEFLIACMVASFFLSVLAPLLIMFLITRIGALVLWVMCIGDKQSRSAYFGR